MDAAPDLKQMHKQLDELRRLYKKLAQCIIKNDATQAKAPQATPKEHPTEKETPAPLDEKPKKRRRRTKTT